MLGGAYKKMRRRVRNTVATWPSTYVDIGGTSIIIMAFAAVQIVVHMIYFLHMNTRMEGGWTVLALIFTLTLVVITLTGSIWVMYHLDTNMMPMSAHDMMHRQP